MQPLVALLTRGFASEKEATAFICERDAAQQGQTSLQAR
jgi:hypothetical protein